MFLQRVAGLDHHASRSPKLSLTAPSSALQEASHPLIKFSQHDSGMAHVYLPDSRQSIPKASCASYTFLNSGEHMLWAIIDSTSWGRDVESMDHMRLTART
jgi:hypothetical protein